MSVGASWTWCNDVIIQFLKDNKTQTMEKSVNIVDMRYFSSNWNESK